MPQLQTQSGTANIINLSAHDTMMVVECANIGDYLSRFSDIIEEQGSMRRANKDILAFPRFWKHWFMKPEDRFDIKALVFYSFMINGLEVVSIDNSIEDSYDETLLVARAAFPLFFPTLQSQKARKRSFTLTDGSDKLTAYVIDTARTKPPYEAIKACNIGDLVRVGVSKPHNEVYTPYPVCKLYTLEKLERILT